MNRVTIIAEAGVNHNGDLDQAIALVDAAVKSGADLVKFQTFRSDALTTRASPKADYQKRTTGEDEGQYEMLKALELSRDAHKTLKQHCTVQGIGFLSTPFDTESLRFLVDDLGMGLIKIGSGDLTNGPLLLAAAQTGRDIILSTGMAVLDEISEALGVLAHGYLQNPEPLSRKTLNHSRTKGTAILADKVTLLQCTTEYPAPPTSINLRVMATLMEYFGLRVGFSDHSDGTAIPVAAAALGAVVIEKHMTLDRSLPGPDQAASLEPAPFARMVDEIRTVEVAVGDGVKRVHDVEKANVPIARKSLVAAKDITVGEVFSHQNVTVKRPGDGMTPMGYWDLLGRQATVDYPTEAPIREVLD